MFGLILIYAFGPTLYWAGPVLQTNDLLSPTHMMKAVNKIKTKKSYMDKHFNE
jgi:hypothetical protein